MILKRISFLIFSLIYFIPLPSIASRVIFIVDYTGEICGEPGECWIDESEEVVEVENSYEDESAQKLDDSK